MEEVVVELAQNSVFVPKTAGLTPCQIDFEGIVLVTDDDVKNLSFVRKVGRSIDAGERSFALGAQSPAEFANKAGDQVLIEVEQIWH
ncbi:hypothetical protein [Ruegeria hyattellae]|uniref:hypothetical protein n=1 Tax=Ruegeria hyattellae TaxID=3233337 RepID=UPI00355BFA98